MIKDEEHARKYLPNPVIYPVNYFCVWLNKKDHVLFKRINKQWVAQEPETRRVEKA